jgi:SAM-dependent methyltransferase
MGRREPGRRPGRDSGEGKVRRSGRRLRRPDTGQEAFAAAGPRTPGPENPAIIVENPLGGGMSTQTGKRRRRSSPAGGRDGRNSAARPDRRDRHYLYQTAVQSPEADIRFFDRVYGKRRGRKPSLMREDFCGTAHLSAGWVRTRRKNRAIGVDLDRETLEWGRRYNLAPLGEAARRVRLVCADVRRIRKPKVDLVAAMNFSYFVFKDRKTLQKYFEGVRKSLAPGGMLALDIFGGSNSQAEITEKKRLNGFTYVWEQVRFDPISHEVLFHIHFRFHGGGGISRAFVYDWRLWSIPEVREVLREAGFRTVEVYWEGTESDTGEGDGVFRLTRRTTNHPGWIAYIVAWKD